MIFPWLYGFLSFQKSPMTWGLVLLNFFLYVGLPSPVELSNSRVDQKINSPAFLKVQAFHYLQFLKTNPNPELNELFQALDKNESSERDAIWISQASFRDAEFLANRKELPPYPDQVLQAEWESTWQEFLKSEGDFKTLTAYGISYFGQKWTSYLTYQFIHSGWLHLLSNMLVLIIFGAAIEMLFGPTMMALVYILGGVAGAIVYALTTGIGFAPLVGASGSVSALMGFYLIAEIRRNIAYYYFFSPMEGHFGVIYLSKWWIIATALLNDFAALVATPDWMMGVAHTVHLGSAIFGMCVALAIKLMTKQSGSAALRHAQTLSSQSEQNLVA